MLKVKVVIGAVAMAAATIAGLAVAPAASAQTVRACAIQGSTTSLTPIPVTGASTGSYTFTGSYNCVDNGAVQSGTLTSSGTYSNIQCGTGTATGVADFSDGSSYGYTITFVAGQGSLQVTSGGTGGGTVSIVPQTGGCVTGPATSFTVEGNVAVAAA